ncbi:MAG: hypothetical protein IPH06_06145 [Alphaproteobacteria bacterium]|nr:hypothetical protein [Alphaproteobacteria bacterium]QQS57600.1 MAG: hypothetical protein IPN28_01910 [Alphaproteobacteria bacterium]
MMRNSLFSRFFAGFSAFFASAVLSGSAWAQGVDDIAENMTTSASLIPGLITAFSYTLGLYIAYQAVMKTIEHVNNPNQTPFRVPVVRYIAGGALFSLPIVYEAMTETIYGGGGWVGVDTVTFFNSASALLGLFTGLGGMNFNSLLSYIVAETQLLPGLITAVAYLLGLLMGVIGILKLKDHVEDPARVSLKEGVINLIIGGAMFGLPAVFEAMWNTVGGGGLGVWEVTAGLLNVASFTFASDDWLYVTLSTGIACNPLTATAPTRVGEVICAAWLNSSGIAAFLSGIAYMLGLVFGVWALVKIKNHVLNPQQTSLWDGVSRLIAGGAFFSLPTVVSAFQMTFLPDLSPLNAYRLPGLGTTTGYEGDLSLLFGANACGVGTNSLDMVMACFMGEVLGPSQVVLNFFCFVAGMIFIMIGISRLVKTAQDGPRGPGGMGTVSTFTIGGILISANVIMRAFSSTLFGDPQTATFATLTYTAGMAAAETDAVYHVVSAILRFMIIVGSISFVRGLFIMRQVAEGNQQASLMSSMTHIIGGAMAVNLGPLLNAVQQTIGITAFGVTFA